MDVLKAFIVAIATALIIVLIMALPTMWLWNELMPDIFGLKKIGFSQASGINVLCSILFKDTNSSKK